MIINTDNQYIILKRPFLIQSKRLVPGIEDPAFLRSKRRVKIKIPLMFQSLFFENHDFRL